MPKYSTCLEEKIFIQPDKGITTVNSDNATSVQLVDPNNEDIVYSNQILAGKAHPRTKIAPIVPARSLDITYWKDTPMTTLSIINSRKPQYPSLAGYNTEELVDFEKVQKMRRPITNVKASPLVQTLQPGVFDLPMDYQPIIESEGISETPQFEPIKRTRHNGNVFFTGELPNQNQVNSTNDQKPQTPNDQKPQTPSDQKPQTPNDRKSQGKATRQQSNANCSKENYIPLNSNLEDELSVYNIYDPRFSGYGSDNRAYLDPMVQQIRYYYDDIDAIRRPNYIVRSKIDSCVTDFGDQYGPMRDNQLSLNDTRPLAEQYYLENNLNYRNDLMQTLMSKRNAEMWQNRKAPKYTNKQSLR